MDVFLVISAEIKGAGAWDFKLLGVYNNKEAAEKMASLNNGIIIDAHRIEQAPVVKKRGPTQTGVKSVATLVIDDPTII